MKTIKIKKFNKIETINHNTDNSYIIIDYEPYEVNKELFEVGKWYNLASMIIFIKDIDGDRFQFEGFNYLKKWVTEDNGDLTLIDERVVKPADMEEVKKLMIEERNKINTKGILGAANFKKLTQLIDEIDLVESGLREEVNKPLFTNSHKTKFYEGDEYKIVHKSRLTVETGTARKGVCYEEDPLFSEILTPEQAEEYIKEHTKFERGYYKAITDNTEIIVYYCGHDEWQMIGERIFFKERDFDSIGDKIELD